MNLSKISALETEVSELKKLVKNLLNKLTCENTSLREDLRHLKKSRASLNARHDGNNGYCTVIGNEAFTVVTPSISFLSFLQGRSRVLNQEAIKYMEQVGMARKWVDTLSAYGEVHFLNEAAWSSFLDDHKLSAETKGHP